MQFHVDAAEVTAASARTAQTAGAIRAESAAMLAHLTALEGSWQGSAALAFADVREQWRAAQAQVEAALDAIAQALGAAARSYEDAETAVTGYFAR